MKRIISTLLIGLPIFANTHVDSEMIEHRHHRFLPKEIVMNIEHHDIVDIGGLPFIEFEGQYYDVADILEE